MTDQELSPGAGRRRANQLRHWQKRQQEQASRGGKGIASSWWDRARAVAAEQERAGHPEAWDDLTRFLQNFCGRYEE